MRPDEPSYPEIYPTLASRNKVEGIFSAGGELDRGVTLPCPATEILYEVPDTDVRPLFEPPLTSSNGKNTPPPPPKYIAQKFIPPLESLSTTPPPPPPRRLPPLPQISKRT